jgi:hypothetical protein
VNRCNNRLQPAGEATAYTHRGDLLELVQAACYAEIQQMWSTKSAQNGRLSLVRYATSLGARDIHRALGAEGLEMKAKLAVEHGHAGGNLYAAVGSGCAGGQGNSAVHPDHIGGEGVLTRSALWSRRRRFSVQTISEASSLCLPRLRPMRPFLLRRGFVAPISLLTSSLQLRHFL